jgi:hypothetical protein
VSKNLLVIDGNYIVSFLCLNIHHLFFLFSTFFILFAMKWTDQAKSPHTFKFGTHGNPERIRFSFNIRPRLLRRSKKFPPLRLSRYLKTFPGFLLQIFVGCKASGVPIQNPTIGDHLIVSTFCIRLQFWNSQQRCIKALFFTFLYRFLKSNFIYIFYVFYRNL